MPLLPLAVFLSILSFSHAQCVPPSGCNAMAIYVVSSGDILSDVAIRFGFGSNYSSLQTLNNLSNAQLLNFQPGQLLRIPFDCQCGGDQLGRNFSYAVTSNGEDDISIASTKYANLTQRAWIDADNAQVIGNLVPGNTLTIPVNCSCGAPQVSKEYGFFATYVVQPNDTVSSLSKRFDLSESLLREYNPTSSDNLQAYTSILFIPIRNSSGIYPPFNSSAVTSGGGGTNIGTIVGATAGGIGAFLAVIGFGLWFLCCNPFKKQGQLSDKDKKRAPLIVDPSSVESSGLNMTSFGTSSNEFETPPIGGFIRFSYEELVAITDNFSIAKEIGRGGFATVFYGEFQGQKLAIKKMDIKETKGFVNELRVLSSVHHANLVRLVGYCTKVFLFLVYEYVDNGTLTHHLRSGNNGTQVLSWEKRVQIALDAARGIEYLHDHTTPTYIHRDIKPSNILLDTSYRAKVGDFGLTKLTNPEDTNSTTKQGGTFGYMAPEYAQYGYMSSKADVFAFGVVLFQLVSGKEALIPTDASVTQYKDLRSLFEDVLNNPDAKEKFQSLVDPVLETDFPVELVWKMVKLAERCTRKEPELRPPMREVVIDLMTLTHLTQGVQPHSFLGDNSSYSIATWSQ